MEWKNLFVFLCSFDCHGSQCHPKSLAAEVLLFNRLQYNSWAATATIGLYAQMDRFAREGERLENCYSDTMPGRRAMHKGRFTLQKFGCVALNNDFPCPSHQGRKSIIVLSDLSGGS